MKARWLLWLVGVFTRDLRNKGIALFFAVTIWYFAWNNQIIVSESWEGVVSIQIEEEPGGGNKWEIVSLEPVERELKTGVKGEKVVHTELALSGPQGEIRNLRRDKVIEGSVTVEPESGYEMEGYYTAEVEITGGAFRLPTPSLRVVEESIKPKKILVGLSRVITKELEVGLPGISGGPVSPYRINPGKKPEIEPSKVRVRGAEYYLDRCRILPESINLEGIKPEELSREFEAVARLEHPPEAVPAPVLVDETGKPLKGNSIKLKVTVYFELKSTDSVTLKVNLWAKLPLPPLSDKPVAVTCDRPYVKVKFVGTQDDIDTLRDNAGDPEFGLYFLVDPTRKAGELWPVSITEFRADPRLIPPDVKLTWPEDITDTGIFYKLVEVSGEVK